MTEDMPLSADTPTEPPTLRVVLEFDPEGESPQKYGALVHRQDWSNADFANEVAEMVRRTVTAHLGLNPTLPPMP